MCVCMCVYACVFCVYTCVCCLYIACVCECLYVHVHVCWRVASLGVGSGVWGVERLYVLGMYVIICRIGRVCWRVEMVYGVCWRVGMLCGEGG